MYLIIKAGVYIQGILGAYDNLGESINVANKAINAEPDDYHRIHIYKIPTNEAINLSLDDKDYLVYTFRRLDRGSKQEITGRLTEKGEHMTID